MHFPHSNQLNTAFFFLSLLIGLYSPLSIHAQDDETGFYLQFEESQIEDVGIILDFISADEDLLFDIIDDINYYLYIPYDIPIIFTDCGQANAFYDPEQMIVIICYEEFVQSLNLYYQMGFTEEDLAQAIANNIFATMYHEIGHALVDILELPITGREEDAVDQFAVVSLLSFDELGHQALVDLAIYWAWMAQNFEQSFEHLPFYDEHSLSSQRYYDVMCLAFGSDPEIMSFLVEQGMLPESRAIRCPSEFERVQYAWDVLLEPHYRD